MVVNRLPIKPSGIVPNPFKIVAGIKAITRLMISCKKCNTSHYKGFGKEKLCTRNPLTVKLIFYRVCRLNQTPRTRQARMMQRKTRFEP